MRHKKVLIVLVGVLLIGIATGPSLFAWTLQDAAKPYSGVTIKATGWARPDVWALQKMSPKFEKLTGIKVEWEIMPWIESRPKELLDFTSKAGEYTIVTTDLIWLGEFVGMGGLVPFDKFLGNSNLVDPNLDLDDFFAKNLEGYSTWGSKLYGLPGSAYVHLLYYNKEMLRQAGYTRPPDTWSQFKKMAAKLTNSPKQYGIALQVRRDEHMTCDWALNLHWAFGGQLLDEKFYPQMLTPEGIEALTYLTSLRQYCPPGVAAFGHDETVMALAQSTVGMIEEWSNFCPPLLDPEQSLIVDDLGISIVPKSIKSGKRIPVFGGWSWGVNAFASEKEQDAAYLFMQWAFSKEMAPAWVKLGGTPSRKSIYEIEELKKVAPYFDILVKSLPLANPIHRPRFAEYPAISDVIAINASDTFIGKITPEEALRRMDVEIYGIMSEAGYYTGKKELVQ